MAFLPALAVPGILKAILAPIARLWRWLTADWHRLAFALLIALCGFLSLRLSMVDGERDKWRDRAKQYEAASKAVIAADVKADAKGVAVAADKKGTIDAQNQAARDAARDSDDKLRAGLDRLRAQGAGGRDKATD